MTMLKQEMLELAVLLSFSNYSYLQSFYSKSRLAYPVFEISTQVQNFCVISNNLLYKHKSRNPRSTSNQRKCSLLSVSTLVRKE